MIVSLRTHSPCTGCGYRVAVFMTATVRVNKRPNPNIGPGDIKSAIAVEFEYEKTPATSANRPGAWPTFYPSGRSSMKTVPLHGAKAAGRVALVDDEDYELVMQYRWFVDERERNCRPHGPYAIANLPRPLRKQISMHRLLTGWPRIDHIDHNGLNNQRSNLRPATYTQNAQNQRSHVDSTSKYKGVCWLRKKGKWLAYINYNGQRHYLGLHLSEEDAARAYDVAARREFGEFALLNLPGEDRIAS